MGMRRRNIGCMLGRAHSNMLFLLSTGFSNKVAGWRAFVSACRCLSCSCEKLPGVSSKGLSRASASGHLCWRVCKLAPGHFTNACLHSCTWRCPECWPVAAARPSPRWQLRRRNWLLSDRMHPRPRYKSPSHCCLDHTTPAIAQAFTPVK